MAGNVISVGSRQHDRSTRTVNTTTGPSRRAELAVAAALLSAGAAAIHASVAGPHFEEYAPHGILFVATSLAQAAWAALVIVAPSARVLAAGALGNAGVVVAWALSRTIGLPLGPHAWTPEPVTALDVGATAFECGIVAASAALLAAGGPRVAAFGRTGARFAVVGAAVVAGLTGLAFAGTENGAAGHHGGSGHHAEPVHEDGRAGGHEHDRHHATPHEAGSS